MRRLPRYLLVLAGALLIAALTLYAYRELLARPFAADDYQWLLNVRGLGQRELLRTAFDPRAQTHFYRPLVWLLFWGQLRMFGLDPRGFHIVSLGLHLLNAGLTGWLAWRLLAARSRIENRGSLAPSREARDPQSSIFSWRPVVFVLAMAIVALHPAPFEAVAWVSAQSELLAAALLLLALHAWLSGDTRHELRGMSAKIEDRGLRVAQPNPRSSIFNLRACLSPWLLLATLALALALLAKESAAIGLALLVLLGWDAPKSEDRGVKVENRQGSIVNLRSSITYLLPALVTLGYIALQVGITRRNYLLAQGGYGLGPQLLLNPLRSLALLVAPLPGSEHADAAWLAPAGAAVALLLLGLLLRGPAGARRLVLALGVTLLPTAPFISPPDSRYLYLPAMAAALLIVLALDEGRRAKDQPQVLRGTRLSSFVVGLSSCAIVFGLMWAAFELHEREWRFAAGAGPGGSLWRAASQFCAAAPPERVVLVEPPIAPPHAEAIVGLACGADTRTLIVGRDQVDGAIKGRSVVVVFPGGSATVERTT